MGDTSVLDPGVESRADPGVDRLRLLASAIAGRTVEVAVGEPGRPAWTDGATVHVDPAADPTGQLRSAAVQAALLAAGSLDPAIVGQLSRRPALARRYLAVEGHRALAAHEALLPPVVRPLIDPTAVAAARAADGRLPPPVVQPPGDPAVVAGAAGAAHEQVEPPEVGGQVPTVVGGAGGVVGSLVDPAGVGTAEGSLAVARSRVVVGDPPVSFGVIRPRRLLAAAAPVETAGAASSDPAPRPLPAGAGVRPDQLDELDDGGDDVRNVGQVLASPVGGQGLVGRLLQRLLRPTREPGGGGPPGADAPTRTGHARGRGRDTTVLATVPETGGEPATATAATEAFGPQVRTYPEWDVHRRRYRPDWCTVRERDPRPQDLAPVSLPDGLALRRPLARLGAGLDRVRRRPQGDDIDVDAAVEAQVAIVMGEPPAEAVYVESLRRRRDLAVLILLDVSGSAAEPGPGGRTVHEHQRAAAAALATAVHDLGDRVALHAFNSQGRRAVHVTRVKGFDDRFDGQVVRRLGGLVPRAYTRLGAAIRHGASVLEERGGTSRRLLLVLSDGFAYDHGYGGRYGEADARRALTEARRRGLGCLCLSVGGSTPPAALRRVFGPAAHAAVPTLDRLPALVGPLFRAALRRAEAERRSFQRKQIDDGRTP